ncbi:hypothetical protein [Hyphomonas sp.]|uniref:hypothetical protein n=1 Tax=Hyphomonas sp. TaxID=87 RepID=UPI0025C004C6|nr:hypothetical protein [Hyphomonas sp.]
MLEKMGIVWNPGWPSWSCPGRRDGWLIVWTLVMAALAAVSVAIADLSDPESVEGAAAWGTITTLCLLAYMAAGIFAVLRSRVGTSNQELDDPEHHPSFHRVFLLTSLMLCVLAWIAFGHHVPFAHWPWSVDLNDPTQRSLYIAAIISSFVPLLFGFHTIAREAATDKANYLMHPEGPTSWFQLGVSAGALGFLSLGAWAAGERWFSMEQDFGLVVMSGVIAGFLAFIFVPHLGDALSNRRETDPRPVKAAGVTFHPGYITSGIDAAAVRLIAPLSGATQSGWMIPQLILTLIFLPLTAMGYALPAPWGLVPICIAGVIIFGLGRRWAWVEDDREKALRIQSTRSSQFRLGFANDLRDEALMGYAWLFILVPLALRQIQMHFDLFEPVDGPMGVAAQSAGLMDWLKFFGTELAKGVPIVDWVDIYDVNQEEPFAPKGPMARHIVFVSRLLVDVVLIAALLQAFGIMQRNRAQERLFEAGQIDFFDPFMERRILRKAFQPAEHGAAPLNSRYLAYFETHREKSKDLDKGDYYYNTRRLNELFNDRDRKVREVVRWFAKDLIVGSVTERLNKLADLYERTSPESRDKPDWSRKFYRFFDDVVADGRNLSGSSWKQEHSIALSRLLFQLTNDKEYDQVRNRALLLLGRSDSLHAARALAARLVRDEHATTLPGISKEIAETYRFARQPRLGERSLATESLFKIKGDIEDNPHRTGTATLKFIEAVLEYVRNDGGNGSIPT